MWVNQLTPFMLWRLCKKEKEMLVFLTMLDDPAEATQFNKLYNQYKNLALWAANRILNDNHLAEDAVQEAFTRIARNFSAFSKKNPVECNKTKNFIVIIVERAAIDIYRKRKRMLANEISSALLDETTYALEDKDIEEENRIYAAIRSLPKKYGEVLLLHYVNGLNSREIAEFLAMNENTVRTNLTRGKRRLELLLSNFLTPEQSGKESKD